MNRMNAIKRVLTSKWILGSAAALAIGIPAVANADPVRFDHRDVEHREVERRDDNRRDFDRHDDHRGYEHRDDRHDHVGFDLRIGRQPERVWVPPVYRTVCEQQWVAPVYNTVTEQILVPDRFEDRTVRYQDHGRWCTRVDHLLIEPAHYITQTRQVCVTEGHYQNVDRQVLVTDGHWETRSGDRVAGLDIHVGH